jgi:hypothetical protein
VILKNAIYPVIVQLTDEKGEVKYEQFADKSQFFDFNNLTPAKYYIRVVFDTNGNKKYDTGNYLKKLQPESISHFPELLDARANWDEIIEFELISK